MSPRINVDNVKFFYGRSLILDGISLTFAASGVIALMGANGSGKTTLLKLLLGILKPRSGNIYLNEKPLQAHTPYQLSRKVSYVPQAHHCAFPYSVFEIVMMARQSQYGPFGRTNANDRTIANQALERLGITNLTHHIYSELSGGERQLVLIARALAQQTKVIVMDEPVSGLDYGNQIRLLEETTKLARDGLMIIKSTHHPDHALMVADRIIMIHEKRVLAQGPPKDVINEQNMRLLYQINTTVMKNETDSWVRPQRFTHYNQQ